LEDSLQGQVQQTLAELIKLPFKDGQVRLDRRRVREDGRQPNVEAAQLVESRAIERVPRLVERRHVIVLVNDRRDAVLPAVRREQLAMIVLNCVVLVVGPGGRLQLCHARLNHLGDERRGSHLDEVHRHDRRRQVDGRIIGWASTLAMPSDMSITKQATIRRTIILSLVSINSQCTCMRVPRSSTYSRSVVSSTNESSLRT